ncbi:restriction endonuclease [Candidatus Magnetoovum chiemensis]|nr:restriction endonuclease [Candidatus Magnetoovum chiemensis]
MELTPDFDFTEILNGEKVMTFHPLRLHQHVSQNINRLLVNYVYSNKLGNVFYSPLDVILQEGVQVVQPDLLFIKKENAAIEQDWIRGVPDMICEIIGKGTYIKDTVVKKEIYEACKVPEYWMIFPELLFVEVFVLDSDEKYFLYSYAEGKGTVKSKILEGFEFNIKDIIPDN